jgi:large subunit ribosomal protein L3
MKGIIGKKVGMTSVFDPSGKQTACTIIEAGPCVVTQVRTKENDGYEALQLSFGDKNDKHSTLAEKNHFAKASTSPKKFSKEFRNTSLEKNIGETVTVDIFSEGDKVEVKSKRKEAIAKNTKIQKL